MGEASRVLMDRRFESSPLHVTALGRVSDIQVVGFNGFGNATSDSGHAQSFFDVHQRQWLLNPAVGLSLGSWTDISLGPVVQHSVVDSARSPFLAETRPYGFGTFDQAGLMLNAKYERVPAPGEDETFVRDRYLVQATGAYYPAMWDVRSPFEVASLALGASFEIPDSDASAVRGARRRQEALRRLPVLRSRHARRARDDTVHHTRSGTPATARSTALRSCTSHSLGSRS